ncbi:MAG TPA: metal-dependent hydrolase [Acidimicrobiales bacterium]|nr:metal-dependent hydrolase [Acidimicrobiales bacterium]
MVLWFVACAVLGAWSVLRDANFDYRLIAFGALVPDALDAVVFQHRALAHTLVFAVGSLIVVMLATVNRRSVRRHLIALPIGFLAHLVLDAVWADQALFWWPGFGDWGATSIVPPLPWLVIREALGVVAAFAVFRMWRAGKLSPC